VCTDLSGYVAKCVHALGNRIPGAAVRLTTAMQEPDPVRLSEYDPVFTATAVPRCVLSFKVSCNHRDTLPGEEKVEVNWNWGRGGDEFWYFIA
jgi:hypothetical protein